MDLKIKCIECHNSLVPEPKKRQTVSTSYSKMKKGIRADIHSSYSFKSAAEANFARILNHLGLTWKYEERAFSFSDYKTKPYVYIMDFEIINGNSTFPAGFYEVKGYMTASSRQKLRRLKKTYPEEFAKTTVVVYNKYKKKDIEFCEKQGYKIMLFDDLTTSFSNEIKTWE
jgi:hypothetical protein